MQSIQHEKAKTLSTSPKLINIVTWERLQVLGNGAVATDLSNGQNHLGTLAGSQLSADGTLVPALWQIDLKGETQCLAVNDEGINASSGGNFFNADSIVGYSYNHDLSRLNSFIWSPGARTNTSSILAPLKGHNHLQINGGMAELSAGVSYRKSDRGIEQQIPVQYFMGSLVSLPLPAGCNNGMAHTVNSKKWIGGGAYGGIGEVPVIWIGGQPSILQLPEDFKSGIVCRFAETAYAKSDIVLGHGCRNDGQNLFLYWDSRGVGPEAITKSTAKIIGESYGLYWPRTVCYAALFPGLVRFGVNVIDVSKSTELITGCILELDTTNSSEEPKVHAVSELLKCPTDERFTPNLINGLGSNGSILSSSRYGEPGLLKGRTFLHLPA